MPSVRETAPWLEIAWQELGVAERAGIASEPRVVGYYREAGYGEIMDDGVPWCAAFVGACLKRAGAVATGSLMARSYARAGRALDEPQLGAIAVFSRGSDPASGHVGLVVGWSAQSLIIIAGNQSDAVSIASVDRDRLVALRWPDVIRPDPVPPMVPRSTDLGSGEDQPLHGQSAGSREALLFQAALAHVLAMEGGFTDDRFDPGGATNFGITIADYAEWRGEDLTADTHRRLRAELRAIAADTVEAIYRKRYWKRSSAGSLPPALALMHFDAAVNHGVSGACRLMQTALGVTVDGEIGPRTLAAARSCDVDRMVTRYAELRRARYRALPHFWRFGRGWLHRVDATVAAARRVATTFMSTSQSATEISMTKATDAVQSGTDDTALYPAKWWGHSMTIWGAAITAAATVLPALSPVLRPVIGIDLTPDIVRQTTADVVQISQALAGVVGTVMTVYGRLRAASRLESRSLVVRI